MANQIKSFIDFKCFMLSIIAGMSLFFTGCLDKDDYLFDPEYVKELYERTFPVKNIDPMQDWKTTNVVDVHVAVNLEASETYTLNIYSANPLNNTDARVLGSGKLNNGGAFSIKVNNPKDRSTLFISCKNSKGKCLVQQFKVENDGTVNALFGTGNKNRARSIADRSIDEADYRIDFDAFGLDLDEIRVDSFKYTRKDADIGVPKNKKVWIPEGEMITRNVFPYFGGSTGSGSIIVIDGTMDITTMEDNSEPGFQIAAGLQLVVGATGKLNVKTSLFSLGKLGAKLIILEGGIVNIDMVGRSVADFLKDGSDLPVLYNAGTLNMTMKGAILGNFGQPVIYNCGTATIDRIESFEPNLNIVNHSNFYISDSAIGLGFVHNFCNFTVGNNTSVQKVIVGKDARISVGQKFELGQSLTFGDQAIADVGTFVTQGTTAVVGPGPDSEFAVLKLRHFEVGGKASFSNVVYVEQSETGSGSGYQATIDNIQYYLPMYDANITIEGSDCNGAGYTSPPAPERPDPEPEYPLQSYTYCFEDYYPTPGDYDFNDVVMDLTFDPVKENGSSVSKLIVNVTLSAVGASYQLGAALQLVGVSKSGVNSVSVDGSSFNDNARVLFDRNWEAESVSDVVIPLFNDAHYVLTGQNSNRFLFNTSQGHEGYADATPRKITIEVLFNEGAVNDVALDNLDLFIARPTISDNGYYENQEGRTRVEIHLYQFWENITSKSVDFAGNIAAAGNRTWAICVPDFKYPYEQMSVNKAYPSFEGWAQDHSSNEDWYKSPVSGNVYR